MVNNSIIPQNDQPGDPFDDFMDKIDPAGFLKTIGLSDPNKEFSERFDALFNPKPRTGGLLCPWCQRTFYETSCTHCGGKNKEI